MLKDPCNGDPFFVMELLNEKINVYLPNGSVNWLKWQHGYNWIEYNRIG